MNNITLEKLKEARQTLKEALDTRYKKMDESQFDDEILANWQEYEKSRKARNVKPILLAFVFGVIIFLVGILISCAPVFSDSFSSRLFFQLFGFLSGVFFTRHFIFENCVFEYKLDYFKKHVLRDKYQQYAKNMVLEKDEITPLYEILNNYYIQHNDRHNNVLSLEIDKLMREGGKFGYYQEVGSYLLLEKLYDLTIHNEVIRLEEEMRKERILKRERAFETRLHSLLKKTDNKEVFHE